MAARPAPHSPTPTTPTATASSTSTDYACDSRVAAVVSGDSRRVGPPGYLVPQDLLIAFSDGTDADGNGFATTSPAGTSSTTTTTPSTMSSTATAPARPATPAPRRTTARQLGSCPNCMVVPLRVGDSFIADVNHFAQAALYATDNNVQIVQEALGTLNNSSLARDAVDYAYRHGTTVIASAADEAAQHNNWPSSLPHVILVNSVTDSTGAGAEQVLSRRSTAAPTSTRRSPWRSPRPAAPRTRPGSPPAWRGSSTAPPTPPTRRAPSPPSRTPPSASSPRRTRSAAPTA